MTKKQLIPCCVESALCSEQSKSKPTFIPTVAAPDLLSVIHRYTPGRTNLVSNSPLDPALRGPGDAPRRPFRAFFVRGLTGWRFHAWPRSLFSRNPKGAQQYKRGVTSLKEEAKGPLLVEISLCYCVPVAISKAVKNKHLDTCSVLLCLILDGKLH